jgi:hypothetical protein
VRGSAVQQHGLALAAEPRDGPGGIVDDVLQVGVIVSVRVEDAELNVLAAKVSRHLVATESAQSHDSGDVSR